MEIGSDWPLVAALFDASHYGMQAGIESKSHYEKLRHFADVGVWQGLSPSPLFDSNTYYDRATALGLPAFRPDEPIFLHWLRHGLPARIVPTSLFDEEFYVRNPPRKPSRKRGSASATSCPKAFTLD
jgi:hypothetical protein